MTSQHLRPSLITAALLAAFAQPLLAAPDLPGRHEALARLNAEVGTAQVTLNEGTGAARFVRIAPAAGSGARQGLAARARPQNDGERAAGSRQFIQNYRGLFGMRDAASELDAGRVSKDRIGHARVAHQQLYQGVPVFGGELKTHYDASGAVLAVSGNYVPNIDLDAKPKRTAQQAADIAVARVKAGLAAGTQVSHAAPVLMVYNDGVLKSTAGTNRLVWLVVVGNGRDVREFVMVDAHAGKVIEQITGIHDGKNRRAFDGAGAATAPGPNYPATPFWKEGDAFPTGNVEADNMIAASSDVHDFFKRAFGRDSFNGAGATMDSIFNRGWGCVNASWNGSYISFCPGTTSDDVTAHEWGHAYTEYTHGLIYAWQPGALNEAYSDIWGETIDRLNGRQTDVPDNARTPGACTVSTPLPPALTVNQPSTLAAPSALGTAQFGPQSFSVTGDVVVALSASGVPSQGCSATYSNASAVAGRIAYVDRGSCTFTVKAANAAANGAIGLIIGNNQGGTTVINMSGSVPGLTMPSVMIPQNDAALFKTAIAGGQVNVTMSGGQKGSDNSVRWLMGEDASAFGGAIRDMYNPGCYGQPAKVSDKAYVCAAAANNNTDQGGVHTNSGVPNHAYALIVDGGSYNGQAITGIGLTKAAHIYWRAQSVYQGPTTDFAGHADAIEQSCRDLRGANLNDLKTGAASGQTITDADCAQVAKAMVAVEMRTPPAQCNYQPVLAKNPPALCPAGSPTTIAADNFDGGRRTSLAWSLSNSAAVPAEFTRRNWAVTSGLPGGRAGYAMFATDPNYSCAGGDQSGTLRLDSPEITIPAGATTLRMAFDHWIASEADYDGGNLKVSVDGGPWTLVAGKDFVFNPYNATLATAAAGNSNPMAGQPAFQGTDQGSLGGSWGRSIVDLAPYAKPGNKVRLRFEFGADFCGGIKGWYVDDLSVYSCPSIGN